MPTRFSDLIGEQHRDELQTADVLSIIGACKDSGVRELTFRGLHISLGKKLQEVRSVAKKTEEIKKKIQETAQKRSLEQDEFNLRDDEVADMMINDPVKYQNLVLSGELKDVIESKEED